MLRAQRDLTLAVVIGLLCVGIVSSPVDALAASVESDPMTTSATSAGDALANAGPLVGDAMPVVEREGSFVAVVPGAAVEIPSDPEQPLVLDGALFDIAVDLPVPTDVDSGVVDESGAVVYESANDPVSVVAQAPTGGGMQVLVVIEDSSAPTEYRFPTNLPEGAQMQLLDDGGVAIVTASGAMVSVIAPAWARDAHGGAVPTRFSIDGATLVQTVDHAGAVYPVVADPCWSCLLDVVANVVGITSTVLAAANVLVVMLGGAAICAVVCTVVAVAFGVYSFVRQIQANIKSCRGKQRVNVWKEVYVGCR